MNSLEVYVAQDRRVAMARGETLSDRVLGSVLFADISGFTPLTEAYTRTLGIRRGAEELTRQLNRVYDALIAQIESFGGSVILFSGDAVTCFFKDESGRMKDEMKSVDSSLILHPSAFALPCAFALQQAMREFSAVRLPDGNTAALALKVTVASGTVRRFAVGDPNIRLLDVIAGSPVSRTGTAEHLAHAGEILIDQATAEILAAEIEIQEWRVDDPTQEKFAVIKNLRPLSASPPPPLPFADMPPEILKPWLHAGLSERVQAEGEAFLTELRPVVAMFIRFLGIDYDNDAGAGDKLNQLITRVQQTLARYDGALLELTIGDKGSYFYATFGVPHTHEDDARRAVYAARELFPLCSELGFLQPLQVGISQGVMRVGGYGSATRRMYGAQGDEVNLAARLMTEAAPGQLLISGRIQAAVANDFDLEPLPPIRLKGKAEPLLPFIVQGLRETRVYELQEAYYTLPMIGREREAARVFEKLEFARRGQGQIVGITAPAGMGKSRLTAELIRAMRRRGEATYGGECQSFGENISYLVWTPLWRAFFGVDSQAPLRRQVRALEGELDELVPERMDALPLLGAVMHLPLPENDFTRALEPEFRKSALEALLLDCVRAAAQQARAANQAILFVVEDAHWIDPASRELLELLTASISELPVLIALTYRPLETDDAPLQKIETLEHFTKITLNELTNAQGEGLIRAKLAQHAPENTAPIPNELLARITAQAQGNPFYIEQLLDYLHDRGMNLRDPEALEKIELPNTLHRLVLSRIDQLSEQQQLMLKAASIIGRWFSVAHLCGYFPRVGTLAQVEQALAQLQKFDLTIRDQPEPDLAYLFKHLVTQQVAYEALAYSTRAMLHETYAHFLETQTNPAQNLDVICYHYDHSENVPKRREYLRRAGEAAAARFANAEAIDYLTRALALQDDLSERCALLTIRERVYDVLGEREKQRADLAARAEIAIRLQDVSEQINVTLRQGWLGERTGAYSEALEFVQQAMAQIEAAPLDEPMRQRLLADARVLWASALLEMGEPRLAHAQLVEALQLARAGGDERNQVVALNLLGTVARYAGQFAEARMLHLEALTLTHALHDRRSEVWTRNNLAAVAHTLNDWQAALSNYADALQIVHEIGDRRGEATLLSNLAGVHVARGEYAQALDVHNQALTLAHSIMDRKSVLRVLVNLGETYRVLGIYPEAQTYTERALQLAKELGDHLGEGIVLVNLSAIELARGELGNAQTNAERALEITRATGRRESEAFVLNTLGQIALARGESETAAQYFENARQVWESLEPLSDSLDAYAGLAQVALQRDSVHDAVSHVEKILAYLDAHPTQRGDPAALAASLTAYRVLSRAHDSRARNILETAHNALQTRAEKISDENLRRSFLENVRANRELQEAFSQHVRA